MGDWYTIGLALGLGTALGVLFAGLLTATPLGRAAAVVLAGAAGALAGALIEDWTEIGGGVIGGLVGAVAAAVVVGLAASAPSRLARRAACRQVRTGSASRNLAAGFDDAATSAGDVVLQFAAVTPAYCGLTRSTMCCTEVSRRCRKGAG